MHEVLLALSMCLFRWIKMDKYDYLKKGSHNFIHSHRLRSTFTLALRYPVLVATVAPHLNENSKVQVPVDRFSQFGRKVVKV